jgi:hypothetical protein
VLGLSAERVVLGWRRRIMARITRVPRPMSTVRNQARSSRA